MKYGLIGKKLGHSFSKEIHEKLGDYEYELMELAEDEVEGFIKSRDFLGINVTMPYKEKVMPYLDTISAVARSIGSVNTIINRGGILLGDNSDYWGMHQMIKRINLDVKDKKVLILGTGGTAKTAYTLMANMGAGEIYKVSRRPDGPVQISYGEAYIAHSDAEIIINTTPKGMYPENEELSFTIDNFKCVEGVVDVIYNPLRSNLVMSARDRYIRHTGGLYMLVAQAAYASEVFTEKSIPLTRMEEVYNDLLCKKENIVLMGMPGAGKTTVGKLVADKTGREFYDVDEEITKDSGLTPAQIINALGEDIFRIVESRKIKELSLKNGAVIATGGGAVLDPNNMRRLGQNGRRIYLDRDPATIKPTSDRPLSSDREQIMKRYEERHPMYMENADGVVDVKGTPDEVAEVIARPYIRTSIFREGK